mmetsp:Transcript_28277/g.64684  ORF Transcript_28277/g.64684 Transcript_28277/m.64684 type:complete len:111 (-) Transcript_28277:57-389(-)
MEGKGEDLEPPSLSFGRTSKGMNDLDCFLSSKHYFCIVVFLGAILSILCWRLWIVTGLRTFGGSMTEEVVRCFGRYFFGLIESAPKVLMMGNDVLFRKCIQAYALIFGSE